MNPYLLGAGAASAFLLLTKDGLASTPLSIWYGGDAPKDAGPVDYSNEGRNHPLPYTGYDGGVPVYQGSYSRESDLRAAAALTPEQQAASDRYERSDQNIRELQAEIARTNDPVKLEILRNVLQELTA